MHAILHTCLVRPSMTSMVLKGFSWSIVARTQGVLVKIELRVACSLSAIMVPRGSTLLRGWKSDWTGFKSHDKGIGQVASAVQVRRMLQQRRSCAISSEVQDGRNAMTYQKERLTFAFARFPVSASRE